MSFVYNQIQYSLEQNDTMISSLPRLFHYGSECIPTFSVLPTIIYIFVALTLLAIWYFLFWRPFDWIRVIKNVKFLFISLFLLIFPSRISQIWVLMMWKRATQISILSSVLLMEYGRGKESEIYHQYIQTDGSSSWKQTIYQKELCTKLMFLVI